LPAPAVAIVGTRTPSKEAKVYARALAYRLARAGVTVWSGGALGIDAAAHEGALDAGGLSVAVIGTGLDHCYPRAHAALYEEIVLTGGALVSPFERTRHATLTTFPQRNGVLAALTRATVVVEAPIKSGARSTAAFARRLHRPLFVVPAPPWDPRGGGNLAEIELGAKILTNDKLLFEFLDVPFPTSPPAETPIPKMCTTAAEPTHLHAETVVQGLSSSHRAVFDAAGRGPRHVDDFCSQTGLPAGLVQEALLTLTLEAVLVEGPAGWFQRAK
jgi:DNA processing protein